MADIVTLTINPAVDISTTVDRVRPVHKLRCDVAKRDPGGGGINVARVIKRFDADVLAIYPVGGPIGQLLQRLVEHEGIESRTIPIALDTREDFTVSESESGEQFRFVLPGPRLAENEWRACFDTVRSAGGQARYVVASGSLPPGVPTDFYALVSKAAQHAGAKFVLDTSGPALKAALKSGAYLIKPSLGEMRELTGEPLEREEDFIRACRGLVEREQVEVVALTLGHYGAFAVSRDLTLCASALPIRAKSAVGAGDSFLGAMLVRLAAGQGLEDAFRYGVAAGSAALLTAGTDLCRREDVERLVKDVVVRRSEPHSLTY
jgi:6-phosphofructokinase 2